MAAEFPAFEALFRAVNEGRRPFPWQARLAAQVVESGWPDAIGVPTGMGKTSCIDIAVWWLARQAATAPSQRSAPTRIWYVVNRRLLVDAAFEHGKVLATVLAQPEELTAGWPGASDEDVAAVRLVGEALRGIPALGTEGGPLYVVRLRGGAELGQRPPDPSQPALLFSTVSMFASRMLFRGYGSSAMMSPVDAALAGTDSLVLLDEAHLARPLVRMCETAARCDLGDPATLLPSSRARPRMIALTATGDRRGERFDLDDEDRQDSIISRRLAAAKPTELTTTTKKHLPGALNGAARTLVGSRLGSACVVFCNTVATARAVKDGLDRELRSSDDAVMTTLLTGRMREREAERVRKLVLDPELGAPSKRDPERRRTQSLIVVTTQTLEVGADLDFDFLVTETASVRALTQRFGRLNRLGSRPHARAVLCHPEDVDTRPPYGIEPFAVWNRLREKVGDPLDLSPGAIERAMGAPSNVPEQTGELLPEHLWEFAKTSQPEPDEPSVELFFEGLDQATAAVSVCWRAYLPPDLVKLVPAVREDEAIEVPLWEIVRALQGLAVTDVQRLRPDRSSLEKVGIGSLRPGDQVVLPIDVGLYDESGWNADSRDPVLDVSMLRNGVLWVDRDVVRRLVRAPEDDLITVMGAIHQLDSDGDLEPATDTQAIATLLDQLRDLKPHPWLDLPEWASFLERFDPHQPVVRDLEGFPPYLQGRKAARVAESVEIRAEAFEELSFDVRSASLAQHVGSVAEAASRVARALGLPDRVMRSIEQAARYHDLGKGDPRFQRWLDPDGLAAEPLAKSDSPLDRIGRARTASGWPRGGRHELLSARLVAGWLAEHEPDGWDAELVLHLVAAHHGHGRPSIRIAVDELPPSVVASIDGAKVVASGDLSRPDWTQPRRFRSLCERHGVWGLALLEAILRQADHAVSGAVEVA